MNGYVSKPIDVSLLMLEVARCAGREAGPAPAPPASSAARETEPQGGADVEAAVVEFLGLLNGTAG
jgi:hypothetical protein